MKREITIVVEDGIVLEVFTVDPGLDDVQVRVVDLDPYKGFSHITYDNREIQVDITYEKLANLEKDAVEVRKIVDTQVSDRLGPVISRDELRLFFSNAEKEG